MPCAPAWLCCCLHTRGLLCRTRPRKQQRTSWRKPRTTRAGSCAACRVLACWGISAACALLLRRVHCCRPCVTHNPPGPPPPPATAHTTGQACVRARRRDVAGQCAGAGHQEPGRRREQQGACVGCGLRVSVCVCVCVCALACALCWTELCTPARGHRGDECHQSTASLLCLRCCGVHRHAQPPRRAAHHPLQHHTHTHTHKTGVCRHWRSQPRLHAPRHGEHGGARRRRGGDEPGCVRGPRRARRLRRHPACDGRRRAACAGKGHAVQAPPAAGLQRRGARGGGKGRWAASAAAHACASMGSLRRWAVGIAHVHCPCSCHAATPPGR
jgi:hypothetical protein